MGIPKIRKDFKAKLKETAKAVLFLDFDGKEYWVPKSICTLIKQKNGLVIATLAAFKFEEITGIEPEDMASSFLTMGGIPLEQHRINCRLVESESYPLKEAQRKQLEKAVQCRYNYLNWDPGTGKTLASLTLANSYLKAEIVDEVVAMVPASLQSQWREKAKDYFPEMHLTILSIESHSFGSSLGKMLNKFEQIKGRKHLILDESHLIKNLSAKRTKNIDKFYKADCVTCCTASAIGKNAADLFYQYSLSDRQIIGQENFNSFAKHFLLFGGQDGDKVVAYQNTKQLSERLSPYTYFLKKEDIRQDMPKKHYHKHYYDMEDRQRKAYAAIGGLINQIQSKTKSGYIPKEKTYQITSFLQKIACGFVPDDEEIQGIFGNLGLLGEAAENVTRIKHIGYSTENKRISEVFELAKSLGNEQMIIWCSYRAELDGYLDRFPDAGKLIGGMSSSAINKLMKSFEAGKFQYLVAMQQMGTGFDLPWVNHAIYSTTTFDWIKRMQSEDRIHRINRNGDCHIYDVIARGSIDERIHHVLEYKEEITQIFNGETRSDSTR